VVVSSGAVVASAASAGLFDSQLVQLVASATAGLFDSQPLLPSALDCSLK
jgi:hypothetical protein